MFSLCTIFTTLWLLVLYLASLCLCVFLLRWLAKYFVKFIDRENMCVGWGFLKWKTTEKTGSVFWFTVVFCLWMNALCAELQSQSKAKTAKCRAGFDHIFNDQAMIIWSRSLKYSWSWLEMPSKNGTVHKLWKCRLLI